jgi:hypothetical protein
LIEAATIDITEVAQAAQAHMAAASRAVLSGFELRSDAEVIRHPDHYADPRGVRMWDIVTKLLSDMSNSNDLMGASATEPSIRATGSG